MICITIKVYAGWHQQNHMVGGKGAAFEDSNLQWRKLNRHKYRSNLGTQYFLNLAQNTIIYMVLNLFEIH